MITTERKVNIDSGNLVLKKQTAQHVLPEERIISINPEVEVKSYTDTAVSSATIKRTTDVQASEPADMLDESEFMPTITREERVEGREEQITHKLSSKAKVMLCVYMATAVILAIIVLATGLAIGGASKEVSVLESEVKFQSAQLAEIDEKLTYLGDELTITDAASELGLVAVDNTTEVELLDYADGMNYEVHTSAFDIFCDFVSGIFGD